MSLDVLITNSGEWMLGEEIPADPWHVLIYRQRGEPRNELHLWLPRLARRSSDFAFKRYWLSRGTRWCVEIPGDPEHVPGTARGAARMRFTAGDGRVRWAEYRGGRGIGDLSEAQLDALLESARSGPYARL